MQPSQLKPLLVFQDVEEFARRHKAGTEAEFDATQKLVDEVNKQENKFQAWVLSQTRQTPKRSEYIIVVHPGPDGERKVPQQGESAKLRVVFGDNSLTKFWEARRIDVPLALSTSVQYPEKLVAFEVTVCIAETHEGLRPLTNTPAGREKPNKGEDSTTESNGAPSISGVSDSASINGSGKASSDGSDSGIGDCNTHPADPSEDIGELILTNDNAVRVNFLLSASEATKNAELHALEQLCGRITNASELQIKAFQYFVLLRDAEFNVDLHEEIPHLKGAMEDPSWANSALGKKFALLNPQQQDAYLNGFRKLLCGICILPGGPGAGKTHFNLFTIAMAQSQPLPRPIMVRGRPEKRCAKVLFLVDMNSPVDDVANRMVDLCRDIGVKKSIIRMKGWASEVKTSDRLNAAEDAVSGDGMDVDFTNRFLQARNLMSLGSDSTRSCRAPSLDEAAWQRYDELKETEYKSLAQYLDVDLWEEGQVIPQRFRTLVYDLYRDTLDAADFIATTPVAASNHFNGMFKPDLVYFDEAPHARELTNLIAIANFEPLAWVFCGDHRQTVPYVGSTTSDCENIYRGQMKISMMERAAFANVIRYELLMNHRAFGGLEQLASSLWYRGRMVSGNDERKSSSLGHIQNYLERFMGGRACTIPRLLVHLKNCGPEGRDGTSAWNPTHASWVMARVRELLTDPEFKHAQRNQPGTILIISPYKKAFKEYKNEIKKLPHWAQQRVETRTVDVVQGHEADFVFLDLVKDKSTEFLDNPNRLCVAVTRARLGEIIMMHPNMVHSATFKRNSKELRAIYRYCQEAGQVVHIDPELAVPPICGDQSMVPGPVAESSSAITDTISDSASNISRSAPPRAPVSHRGQELKSVFPQASTDTAVASLAHDASKKPIIQEAAQIDDGEAWWHSVINGPAMYPAVCPDREVKTEETTPLSPTKVEKKLSEHIEEVVCIRAEKEAHKEAEEDSAVKYAEDPSVASSLAMSVTPCTVGTERAQEAAQIDDGEAWWNSVMNGPATKLTVGPSQGTKKESTSLSSTMVEKKVSEDVGEVTRKKAEEAARKKSEEVARKNNEEGARKKKMEEGARKETEEDVRKKIEEDARKQAEEEMQKKGAEEVCKKVEKPPVGSALAMLGAMFARNA
ncbi:P-loop containing nucleoside triphosphate hydrolase protein [Chaetomidium leptoderma]|uniref:P-loop containing nucleoside triphosphate hydrolase protein n=1 Tax=Chaetomidium leptoderma TaxID=669021 RepID=A0AAN6ZW09_9PEZI|nr:P-loop containing nucleoside triphosphate hydrolase protein [Chaetomidium leptoderma]